MAELVATIPPKQHETRRVSRYAQYFDGRTWKLTLGVDCPADMNHAQNAIYVTAKRRGLNIELRQRKAENAIYVRVIR